MAMITAAERARLARILGMLGSDHEGERENAARLIETLRKRHGLTWAEMLSLPAVEPPPPPPPPDVYANDEARRRQWQAEIRAKAEAERHQWKERARRAAETADKKEATRPPPEPTPAGEWINVYRPSMSISMKIWWASIWLFIFGWALGSVEMGIRWMVSG